jgi:hypothetical protein
MTPTTSTIYIYIHETEWLRVVWIRKGKAVPIEGVGYNESNIYQCIHVSYLFLQHDINGVFLNKIDHAPWQLKLWSWHPTKTLVYIVLICIHSYSYQTNHVRCIICHVQRIYKYIDTVFNRKKKNEWDFSHAAHIEYTSTDAYHLYPRYCNKRNWVVFLRVLI